jgi:5-methylcytosine-specific restriction endonuclease McrA
MVRKFGRDNTFQAKKTKMVLPSEYSRAKKLITLAWHNPYTAKEEIIREKFFSYENLWTGNETRQGRMDQREEVILLKGTTCHICGTELHPSEVEIDHITPRARFKEPTEADRMKHLQPICTSCHRAKTKTDLKVLSRVR